MIAVVLFYAAITLGTMPLVSVAYRHDTWSWKGVPAAALLLFVTYVASNVIAALGLLPLLANMDAACFMLAFVLACVNGKSWSALLCVLFGLEVLRHLAYFAGAHADYILFLNVCFVAQLCCVLGPALVKLMGEDLGHNAHRS